MAQQEFKSLNQELEKLGDETVKLIVEKLIAADKIATGKLIRSIDYKIITRAQQLILEIYGEKYLDNVIEGRKPNSTPPPYKSLIPWVKKRNVKFKGKTNESTAFVIAKSIGKKGIKGIPEIRKEINDLYYKKEQLLAKATEEDILDLIDKLLLKK